MANAYGSAARVTAAENIKNTPAATEGPDFLDELAAAPGGVEEEVAAPTGGAVDVQRFVSVAADFGKSEAEALDMVPILEAYLVAGEAPLPEEEPMPEEGPMPEGEPLLEEEMV